MLCPCSKEISDYGAHNQRSTVTVSIRTKELVWFEEIIEIIEDNASSPVYSLLKRSDEKAVTEAAYDNAAFAEDVVRDIAVILNNDSRILWYKVETENMESIHNHNAYAMVESEER
jgi:GTP cyclohydrolase I